MLALVISELKRRFSRMDAKLRGRAETIRRQQKELDELYPLVDSLNDAIEAQAVVVRMLFREIG